MDSVYAMTVDDSSQTPIRLEGKYSASIICWILGIGTSISWNSLASIEDYYYDVFPLDLITSGKGSIGSYVGVCLTVAAFGAADSLTQGGMLGDLALMCPEFIQSYLAGIGASGALTSALRLLTEAVFSNIHEGLRKGALLFLSISTLFGFSCIFLYAFVFANLPIVKHYRRKAALEGSKTVSSDLSAAGIQTELTQKLVDGDPSNLDRLSNKELLYQNFDYALDLFLINVLSLSIFPGFLYENTGTHQLGSWYPLVLVATTTIGDLLSRYIPLIPSLRLQSRTWLLTLVMSRVLLVPAFYYTAKYGDQGWMIMLVFILGLTNGYLMVCVLMAAPQGYKGPEQNALGNLLVFFLMAGVFLGAALDWLWLIGNANFLSKTTTKIIDIIAL